MNDNNTSLSPKNKRILDSQITSHFFEFSQVLVLLGARQVGKTTLLKKIFPDATYLLVDEEPIKAVLETYSLSSYRQIIGRSKQIIIDEIHLLSDPGRAVKILYDQIEDIQIIATGSSSLHIKNRTGESLAGRKIDYHLYPLTFNEYLYQSKISEDLFSDSGGDVLSRILSNDLELRAKKYNQKAVLNNILINGLYPNTINISQDKVYLKNLADSAIFKDILELNLIENRAKALEILKMLAYQIGNLISYSEIGKNVGLSSQTVQRYIEIFEQSFILYRLYPFFNNKRAEIGKAPKIYFWDLGLRNAIIRNFDSPHIRPDSGAMFENFIISEVKKLISYNNLDYRVNYWRLKSGAEVDLVMSNNQRVIGCEIKMSKGKITEAFLSRYPEAETRVITGGNFI